jgi:TIR domain-containing protein
MAKLFLSYRHDDTGAYAERLAQRLRSFQFETVFLDRDGIRLADDFADRIRSVLSQSTALLVLIGKDWLEARDKNGGRRLDDAADWVRREVALGLSLGLPVVPVLFDGARMPSMQELPAELAPLAVRQGYDVNGSYFDRDANDLARKLEEIMVAAGRTISTKEPAAFSNLLRQFMIIWLALAVVTVTFAAAPSVMPVLPQTLWIFPGAMTLPAFFFWLYWLGESLRPARLSTS